MTVLIRPLTTSDRTGWYQLWQQYLAFYNVTLSEAVTNTTWQRLIGAEEPSVFGLVAVDSDAVDPVGLVHCVLHVNTWSDRSVCYLEDLFVAASARRRRVGQRLIKAVVERGRAEDWLRVYWMTHSDNLVARALYDRITPVTGWVRYDVPL